MSVHLTPAEKLLLELRGSVNPDAHIPTQLLVSGLNKMTADELHAVEQLLLACSGCTTLGEAPSRNLDLHANSLTTGNLSYGDQVRHHLPHGLAVPQPEMVLHVPGFTFSRAEQFATPAAGPYTVWIYRHNRMMQVLAGTGLDPVMAEFVLIPQGEFLMGSPPNEPGRFPDEGPQRRVTITRPFLIARTPLTEAVWEAAQSRVPVTSVSWEDVTEWCAAHDLRLPSEAEWEYACRAGSTTRYCYGDSENMLGEYAWFSQAEGQAQPVGQKLPNAFGLYDVHGNVWEWCQDTYQGSYANAPTDGSAWEAPGAGLRVCRGGGWSSSARYCRSADRDWFSPGIRWYGLGFRPARSVDDAVVGPVGWSPLRNKNVTTGTSPTTSATIGRRDDATPEQRLAADAIGSVIYQVYKDLDYVDADMAREMIQKTPSGKSMLEQIGDASVEELRSRGMIEEARRFFLSTTPGVSTLMRDLVTGDLLTSFRDLLREFELEDWGVGQLVRGLADSVREAVAQMKEPPQVHRPKWSKQYRTAAGNHWPFA